MKNSKKLSNNTKIAILNKIFSRKIEQFGNFFFGHHLKKATPQFHKEIYKLYESDKDRIVLGAPRGHAKTTVTDLVYLAWVIVNKKAKFILLVSDTYSQAVLFLDALKAEFESNDKLKAFYGNLQSKNWSEGEIVANGVMIKAIGAGMKVRGLKYRENRPDLIIVDDLENDELVESQERREKLERWFNGALIPSLTKGGRVIVIGTILHYDSLLAKLLSKDNYTEYYKKTYRAITDNKPLWEEHLNLEELNKLRDEYIAKGQGFLFYAEYQNEPVSSEYQKFKYEKLKFYNEEALKDKLLNTYMFIDRAYSTAKTADFTGIVIVSCDQENNWFVRVAERFKGEERDLIDKLFWYVDKYDMKLVGIEQKAFKYTFQPTLEAEMKKRNKFFTVEELKDGGTNKERRIEALLPRYETGAIRFLKEQKDIIDELVRFPKAIHDDLSDALAYGVNIIKSPSGGEVIQDPYYLEYGTCVK